MRPLLWKEMRELRLWVAGAALFIGAFALLLQSEQFRRSFEGAYVPMLMPVLLAVTAIGIGAGQIARERHSRTLDYLLVRPIAPGLIVWAKFLAGTVAVALLVAGLVGLGYLHPAPSQDTLLRAIREQVGFQAMALALFPRYWCVYAFALFFSVLVDRAAKVAGILTVAAIAVMALAFSFAELAPFSSFVYWLPFIDGGLVLAAQSAAISGMTGTVFSGAAVLLAAGAALLLQRSPERYVGNLGLIAIAALIAGATGLSPDIAAARFPAVPPVGSLGITTEADYNDAGLLATGSLVAVTLDHGVRFFDFSHPSAPKQVADVVIPLWNSDWSGKKAVMVEDTVYLVGKRKGLPVDQTEVAMVRPGIPVEAIALGPVRPDVSISRPAVVAGYLYVPTTREGECRIRIIELGSRREVTSVTIDHLRPREPGNLDPPLFTMSLRDRYLYVATPSALTALDVADPLHPVVTSRLEYHPKAQFLYGISRPLSWQENRLFECDFWPRSLGSFDLKDPAHPVRTAAMVFHAGPAENITGSGGALYQSWRQGVLEFRAEGGDLRALRYLSGNAYVSAIAVSGNNLFALTGVDEKKRRKVQAFPVAAGDAGR